MSFKMKWNSSKSIVWFESDNNKWNSFHFVYCKRFGSVYPQFIYVRNTLFIDSKCPKVGQLTNKVWKTISMNENTV